MNEYKLRITYAFMGEGIPKIFEKKIKSLVEISTDDAIIIAISGDFTVMNMLKFGKKNGREIKIAGVRLYELQYKEVGK